MHQEYHWNRNVILDMEYFSSIKCWMNSDVTCTAGFHRRCQICTFSVNSAKSSRRSPKILEIKRKNNFKNLTNRCLEMLTKAVKQFYIPPFSFRRTKHSQKTLVRKYQTVPSSYFRSTQILGTCQGAPWYCLALPNPYVCKPAVVRACGMVYYVSIVAPHRCPDCHSVSSIILAIIFP